MDQKNPLHAEELMKQVDLTKSPELIDFIIQHESVEFKKWFISIQPAIIKEQIKNRAMELLKPITNYSFSFEGIKTREELAKRLNSFVTVLKQYEKNPQIKNAQVILSILDPSAQTEINKIETRIKQAADKLEKILKNQFSSQEVANWIRTDGDVSRRAYNYVSTLGKRTSTYIKEAVLPTLTEIYSAQKKISLNDAKNCLESNLVSYLMTGDPSLLTSTANLRHYFINNPSLQAEIPNILGKKTFDALLIEYLLKTSKPGRDFTAREFALLKLVDVKQVDDAFIKVAFKNIFDKDKLNSDLEKLKQYKPDLVDKIFSIAKEQVDKSKEQVHLFKEKYCFFKNLKMSPEAGENKDIVNIIKKNRI